MIKVITILLLLTGFNCCYGDVYDNKDQLQEYIDDLSLQDLEKINGYMRNNSVLSRLIIKELLFEQDFLLEPVNVIIPILAVGAGLAFFLSPPSQVEAAVLAGILISGSLFCICFCKALNHFSFQQCCYHAWSHGNETEQADENV